MTRDEWVVLPVAGSAQVIRVRRDDIGDYWPKQFPEGEATMVTRRFFDESYTVTLPLAEFEALLFAPATPAPDETYRDAAVRFAEAWANEHVDVEEYGKARIAFLELHRERERHGG